YYVEKFEQELRNYSNRVPLTTDENLWKRATEIGNEVIWLHTYGERGKARNGANTLFEVPGALQLPEYAVPVGSTMPEKAAYDLANQMLSLGAGRWENVLSEVWNYTVGGVNVIDSWVGYRRKKPKGRKSSPLDDLILTNWTTQLSREFHELLVVLTRLVTLEDEQQQLLDEIMESEKITYDQLQERGVMFPKTTKDRKPRMVDENQESVF
ncbi:MAG: adenine methyltransferase, partial [Yaniella sp.]|nr:adenine methyltransferase [Yaniella sp.]